jgi:plastocyanin
MKRFLFFSLMMSIGLATLADAGEIRGRVIVLERNKDKPLKSSEYAVVYLEGIETAAPEETAVMNQKHKKFDPRLLPVVKGQEVQFLNSDNLQHNVFSPHPEEPFDLGRYSKDGTKSLRFNVLGQHKIYCDIHQEMIADIIVLPNQYFSLTDKQGQFSIKDVPPGNYTIQVWHILGGTASQAVQVTDEPIAIELTAKSQNALHNIREHKNKSGTSYPQEEYSSSSSNGYSN